MIHALYYSSMYRHVCSNRSSRENVTVRVTSQNFQESRNPGKPQFRVRLTEPDMVVVAVRFLNLVRSPIIIIYYQNQYFIFVIFVLH
jgi:hypothetical protein